MGINDHDYGADIGPQERKILREVNEKEKRSFFDKIFKRGGTHAGSKADRYQDHTTNRSPRGPAQVSEPRDLPNE